MNTTLLVVGGALALYGSITLFAYAFSEAWDLSGWLGILYLSAAIALAIGLMVITTSVL